MASMLLVPSAASVSVEVTFEEGRSFVHPGEYVHISLENVDSVTDAQLETPDGTLDLAIDFVEEGNTHSGRFEAPDVHGDCVLDVSYVEGGYGDSYRHTVEVDAGELYVYTDRHSLTPGQATAVHIECLDWAGRPQNASVVLNISASPVGDEGAVTKVVDSEAVDPGVRELTAPSVSEPWLYTITCTWRGTEAKHELLVVPFEVRLDVERRLIDIGGQVLAGPFYHGESAHIGIQTDGSVTGVTATDAFTGVERTLVYSGGGVDFEPPGTSLYIVEVRAELGGSTSSASLALAVNDRAITPAVDGRALAGAGIGLGLTAQGADHMRAGSYITSNATMEPEMLRALFSSQLDIRDSRYYSEATFYGTTATSTFDGLHPDAWLGTYDIVTMVVEVIGFAVVYHGISHARTEIDALEVSGTSVAIAGGEVHLTVTNDGEPASGSAIVDHTAFEFVGGGLSLTIGSVGGHEVIISTGGGDALSWRLTALHGLYIDGPDYVLVGQEFSLAVADEGGERVDGVLLEWDGSSVPGYDGGVITLDGPGSVEFVAAMEGYLCEPRSVTALGDVLLEVEQADGGKVKIMVLSDGGAPLPGLVLEVDGQGHTTDPEGAVVLDLAPGEHQYALFSNGHELKSGALVVEESPGLPYILLGALAALLVALAIELRKVMAR